jgi:hypothetical protein
VVLATWPLGRIMSGTTSRSEAATPTAHAQLSGILGGLSRSRAVAVAAELELADILASGPSHVDVLAAKTRTHSATLFRLLRALASIGVFEQVSPLVFANSAQSELLRRGVPGSLWAAFRVQSLVALEAWVDLTGSIRSGRPAFNEVHGQGIWEFLREHPDTAAVFDESMRSMTGSSTPAVTTALDWARFPVIADIGGGIGTQLVHILDAHQGCRGILFDRPDVMKSAISHDRLEWISGDFFRSVPSGANAYLLRMIIHDWPEPDALRILSTVRTAMTQSSRLLLVEMVVPDTATFNWGLWADLGMLILAGGRERTAPEYRLLLNQARLEVEEIVPTASPFSIVVARRAEA